MKEEYLLNGIAIVGLNGSGKSTLAHALAKELGYWEMDVEDYYFPDQRASRRSALEGLPILRDEKAAVPFSAPIPKPEAEAAILADMEKHPRFVFSGVALDWEPRILSYIEIVFFLQVPKEERIRRIHEREEKRFGPRVLPGGDMFAQQAAFLRTVSSREERMVPDSLAGLTCPIVPLDGTLPVSEMIRQMLKKLI